MSSSSRHRHPLRLLSRGAAVFLAALTLCTGSARSQVTSGLSGYVLHLPAHAWLPHDLAVPAGMHDRQWSDLTRLRLRPSLTFPFGAYLSAEYEISALAVREEGLFPDGAGARSRQVADLTWELHRSARWRITHFIDRLFLRHSSSIADVTIGRQRISWGTGRIWNPTDLFNPLGATIYSKVERDGVDALTAQFHLGSFSDFTIVVNPEDRSRRTNLGIRLRTNVREFDLSLVGGSFDDRVVGGADAAGNFFDAGIRGEALLSAARRDLNDCFVKAIVGMDHQLTPGLYALIEYHFNGEGKADPRRYELARLYAGEVLNVGRQFLAAQAVWQVHPLVMISGLSIASLTDGSGFGSVQLSYSWTSAVTVGAGAQVFAGDPRDEFWYYPHVVYARIDVYF